MKLVPKHPEMGWAPYLFPIALVWIPAIPMALHSPLWYRVISWGAALVAAPVLVGTFWCRGNWVLWPATALTALGLALFPSNPGAVALFPFAACGLGELEKPKRAYAYLGVLVEGFPNLLMAMGPHAGLGNYTRTAEYSVEWVTGVIRFASERGLTRIEATAEGVAEWTDHVLALGQGQLMNEIGSWMTGVNRNLEGKQRPRIMRYSGGHPAYREHCDAVAADGYRKLALA